MQFETITLQVPELLHRRLLNTARATNRSLEEVILHSLTVGSPPNWEDIPDEFKGDLAALDKLDDRALWQIAKSQKTVEEMERYSQLLEQNRNHTITEAEQIELSNLRTEADRFMLLKSQAAALLRWRGHSTLASPF
ncbi:hypothetical protein H6G20_14585 [Desertifilum sp. FACHB-1129]|uniref:Uncharacterized protein n=1 Tax=Desertifilum tharense IPPAS B-1220 TaxID=1781255 RepID=A0A1E5QP59_9CYAN|nr:MULTISPECIES: hypothetical protein [unclassified Desertifilum]MDA0210695.1 hypothetical protein [Cyanobacteria bacterium FC1]OEJ76462.1 hypothetical protein BH720_04335 [Desertifilum tharense IPPAS B-1220]MBD2312895.1 hypothetical protein [Desertifilum sp. FACHB-1129]MBD2323771.1 hypothetical protein [Desertifilum sp. FACHB-866]MBD2333616.1 hypothetical protein [Desertifilum sp. FACHB-868]